MADTENKNSIPAWDRLLKGSPWRAIGLLLALAAVVRLYVLVNTAVIAIDGIEYIQVAKLYTTLNLSEALRQSHPPLYPVLITIFHSSGVSWELAGQLVSFVTGVLTLLPLFFLVRGAFSSTASAGCQDDMPEGQSAAGQDTGLKVALVTGLLFAFQPELARYCGQVRTEASYIFFAMCAIYFGWNAMTTGRARHFALLGLFCAFAYLTRPEGLLVLIISFAWVLLGLARRRHLSWRVRLGGLVIALLPAFLVAGSYAVYISTVPLPQMGRPRITLKRDIQSLIRGEYIREEHRPGTEASQDKPVPSRVFAWGRNCVELLGRLLCKNLYLPLSLLLLLAFVRRRENPRNGPFEAYIVCIALCYIGLFAFVRVCHRLPVQLVAPLLFFPALGYFELLGILRDKFHLTGAQLTKVGAVILLVLAAGMAQQFLTPERLCRQGTRLCGEWIKAEGPYHKPRIATDLARITYYGDGQLVEPPFLYLDYRRKSIDRAGLAELIAKRRADYLAFDESTVVARDKEYLSTVRGLRFIKSFQPASGGGQKVMLYEIEDAATQKHKDNRER